MNIYQDLPSFSPNKAPLRPGRARRLRIVWFCIGIAAGVLLSRAVDASLDYSTEIANKLGGVGNLQNALTERLQTADNAPVETASLNPQGLSEETETATQAERQVPESESGGIAEPPVAPTYPKQVTLKAKSGDTLLDMLASAGLGKDQAHTLVQALRPVYNPRRLSPHHEFSLTLDKTATGQVVAQQLSVALSAAEKVVLERRDDGSLHASKKMAPLVKKTARAGGMITSSLYQTAMDAGVPENLIAELISAYSYDMDLQRDIKSGDAIEVLFEQMQTESGDVVTGRNVLHAALTSSGRTISIYRYTDSKGDTGYYNIKGESVRKALLRTPINGARISSGFGKRRHPVLGYTKMHKGMDFAAATGTPVYAAGDGVVERASRNGGYGNYVRIRHNDKYSTAYAHLHRFGKGVKVGQRIKQGQIIGYVGSTGRSTGPHLHYEILAYGKQVNPSGIKFKTGRALQGRELSRFRSYAEEMNSLIASLPRLKTEVAAADDASASTSR